MVPLHTDGTARARANVITGGAALYEWGYFIPASGDPAPGVGSLTLTGAAPSAEITHVRDALQGTLTLTGAVPTVEITHIRVSPQGALTLTGEVPVTVLTAGLTASPGVGSLTITGAAPSVEITHIRLPGLGSLSLTGGQPVTVVEGPDAVTVLPGVGALTITGAAPSAEIGHFRDTLQGDLTITGQTPTIQIIAGSPVIEVPRGTLNLTGQVPQIILPTKKGAGRRRRKLLIEVDDKVFEVESPQHAQALFDQIRELAERKALTDVKRAAVGRPKGKRIRVGVPVVSTGDQALAAPVEAINKDIFGIYKAAAREFNRTAEISHLIDLKVKEEDEEDAIIALIS